MVDKNGVILNLFKSSQEAEKKTGFCHSNILKVCRGKRNHVGGYYFKYASN
jgi:hypothetical protein